MLGRIGKWRFGTGRDEIEFGSRPDLQHKSAAFRCPADACGVKQINVLAHLEPLSTKKDDFLRLARVELGMYLLVMILNFDLSWPKIHKDHAYFVRSR